MCSCGESDRCVCGGGGLGCGVEEREGRARWGLGMGWAGWGQKGGGVEVGSNKLMDERKRAGLRRRRGKLCF